MSRWESARRSAYKAQGGICWYCSRPMWERTLETKAEAALRFPGLSKRGRAKLICTAEHLKRKADGGKGMGNIVAACAECNHTRHEIDPHEWREIRIAEVSA